MQRAELDAAYRRTRYRVRIGARTVDLRVGERSAALDAEIEALGASHWAWLTAVNPRSERLDEAENRRRLAELDAEIAAEGGPAIAGEALDPDARCPAEPSRLVIAPDLARIARLAARFGQNAYLSGRRGAPAGLVWTTDPPSG